MVESKSLLDWFSPKELLQSFKKTDRVSKIRYNFVVRHGEKTDIAGTKEGNHEVIENRDDPPLTKLGQSQAKKTGEYLKYILAQFEATTGRKFDHIILESSPMLVCIETAAQIAKALDMKKVTLNYRYSEW